MVSINKKTGLIDAGSGWTIKMGSHSINLSHEGDVYILSMEVIDKGMKVVIYNDLAVKGVNKNKADEVVFVASKALKEMGLTVLVE